MSYILDTSTPASKVINVDSRFAKVFRSSDVDGNPLTSHYVYDMKEVIYCPEHLSMICFLQSATIPYSFYNVRNNVNNHLIIDYTDGNGSQTGTYKLVMPDGNYNALQFIDTFGETLGASSNLLNLPWAPGQFRLYKKVNGEYVHQKTNPFLDSAKPFVVIPSFDLIRFRFKMYTSTNSVHNNVMLLKWDDPETTVNDLFGFREDADQQIPYSTNGFTTLTSDKVIDMNDEIHGLYLRTSLTTNGTLNAETGVFGDVLTRIPINCNPGGIIFHEPTNSTHKLQITPPIIKHINVQLTDDHNRFLDLNGMHWQFSVQIDFVPRFRPITGLTKKQRRLKLNPRPKTPPKPNGNKKASI